MPGRWGVLNVDGSQMGCYVSAPADSGRFAGLLVAQHAPGVDSFLQTMCDRLAAEGFVALAPDLYHRDPGKADPPLERMARLRDANVVRDFTTAYEHLRTLPNVDVARLGITGFCMGGRVAYLMATHLRGLRAAVVFYGGNIMVPWGEGEAPFDRTTQIECPTLGLFGEEDTNPSPADVAKIDAELTRLGKPHEFHMYPNAGHAFMNWEQPPRYRQHAAEGAWPKCVAWFKRHLA
ncbi:MAG: dienelactone hydrolase family protein [Chloroflexi bacterium]|nr:dienelactone hydrolase family protein [Chloroflexota bacterium]